MEFLSLISGAVNLTLHASVIEVFNRET